MKKKVLLFLIFCFIFLFSVNLKAQVTGGKGDGFDKDSVIVFDSPTPLLTLSEVNEKKKSSLGADIIFSGSGFGGGMFWDTELSDEFRFGVDFFITGVRKSDELEQFNPYTGELFVPFKVNRLYAIPFNFGVKYFPFNDIIINTFRPFISGGLGFAFIISTPYDQGFFDAFDDGIYYTRPSFSVAIGADFSGKKGSTSVFQLRYFSIPFGDVGLQSLDEKITGETPITNFGGIFLDLRVGFNF